MQTPDGKNFTSDKAMKPLGAAFSALLGAGGIALRGAGKVIITTWRLAAALDSALWRGSKLAVRRAFSGAAHALGLMGRAFQSVILWLPTRFGRVYSALSGVILIVSSLWIADELRAGIGVDTPRGSVLRPPIDEEDPILARIEGRYVHLSEIEAAAHAGGFLREVETLTPKSAFDRGLVESYVEQRLLARAALDQGLQRSPRVLRRVNAARDRILAASYMEDRLEESVTDGAVERFYNSQKDITQLGDEVRARHILVETGEEAEEVITRLNRGDDFGGLARTLSIDRATAPLGGEVGWFTRSLMTKSFSDVAFATPPGELAPPFQTEFGWHIVEVLDRRATNAAPFSEVRDRIEDFLRLHTIDNALEELSDSSQVVYFRPVDDEPETQLLQDSGAGAGKPGGDVLEQAP